MPMAQAAAYGMPTMRREAMSDAAVEAVKEQYRKALHLADVVWRSENDGVLNQDRLTYLREQYVGMVFADFTADLTARLASAERTIGEFKATNRLLYGERDTLKAAIEQARYAELERTTALLNEIMPRYREMFEAAGLGDFNQSVVFQIASDALASAAGGRRE